MLQVDHMTGLVNDFPDASRTTTGFIQVNIASTDVRHIFNMAKDRFMTPMREKRHHL